MSAPERMTHSREPIRHLISPDLEQPAETFPVLTDRRKSDRFTRRLPAVITCGTMCHNVICKDIGYGGARVETAEALAIGTGDETSLTISLGHRTFVDTMTVTGREEVGAITVLHLGL